MPAVVGGGAKRFSEAVNGFRESACSCCRGDAPLELAGDQGDETIADTRRFQGSGSRTHDIPSARSTTRSAWFSTAVDDQVSAVAGPRDKGVRIGRTRVGKGVIARRRYAMDAVIGEIEGEVICDEDYGSYYCMNIGNGNVLEPDPPFRYVNHSCEPNCEFDWFDLRRPGDVQASRRVFLIALRDIKPGEELTIDYQWAANAAIPCRCQSPSCRGWIVDPKQLDLLNELIAAQLAPAESATPAN